MEEEPYIRVVRWIKIDQRPAYKKACFNTHTTYISTTIDKFKGDKKKLQGMVKYLTGSKPEKILPSYSSKEDLANEMKWQSFISLKFRTFVLKWDHMKQTYVYYHKIVVVHNWFWNGW